MPPVSNGNATLWVRKPHIHSGEPHDLGPGATSLSGHLSSQSAPTLCWEPLPGCPPRSGAPSWRVARRQARVGDTDLDYGRVGALDRRRVEAREEGAVAH